MRTENQNYNAQAGRAYAAEQQAKQAAYDHANSGLANAGSPLGLGGCSTLKDESGTLRASASALANSLEALEERLSDAAGKLFEERLSDAAGKLFPSDTACCPPKCPVPSLPGLSMSIERAQNTASRLHNILSGIAERL